MGTKNETMPGNDIKCEAKALRVSVQWCREAELIGGDDARAPCCLTIIPLGAKGVLRVDLCLNYLVFWETTWRSTHQSNILPVQVCMGDPNHL